MVIRAVKRGIKLVVVLFLCLFIWVGFSSIRNRRPDDTPGREIRTSSPSPARADGPALIPGGSDFFEAHPEFGKPGSEEAMPNWAFGKRQRVTTDAGRSLLLYEKAGQIVTVYEDVPSRGRVKVWGEFDQ